jgi:TPR repeat protein
MFISHFSVIKVPLMKRSIKFLALTVSLVFANDNIVYAQDLEKALEAVQNGDYDTALKEWRLAAEQGNARAQYNLGVMHQKGEGVTQDYQEAVKWYRLAAEQGNASAQFTLGYMYDNGEGVAEDNMQAVKWYRKAAEQGDA